MHKLKNPKVLIAVLLSLGLIGGGTFYVINNNKTIEGKDAKIAELEANIQAMGDIVSGYKLVADVSAGKKIEESDFEQCRVTVESADTIITDLSSVLKGYYRVDMTKGTVLTNDVVNNVKVTDDQRLLDIVTHSNPVGIEAGKYVDIRISLPRGEDFIALSHKKVQEVNGGVLKLIVSEEDIHTYNSMLVDSLLYGGTQIYAVEYVEGGVQKPADTYYPMSTDVLSIAQKDPNLLNAIKSDMLNRRSKLDSSLQGLSPTEEDEVNAILEKGKERLNDKMSEAEIVANKRKEELEAQKKAEEAANGGGAATPENSFGTSAGV